MLFTFNIIIKLFIASSTRTFLTILLICNYKNLRQTVQMNQFHSRRIKKQFLMQIMCNLDPSQELSPTNIQKRLNQYLSAFYFGNWVQLIFKLGQKNVYIQLKTNVSFPHFNTQIQLMFKQNMYIQLKTNVSFHYFIRFFLLSDTLSTSNL